MKREKSPDSSSEAESTEDAPQERRSWEDPRTGVQWTVVRIPAKSVPGASGPPLATLVFEGHAGRFWAGYAGGKDLSDMDDTDLILAWDSAAAMVR